MEPRPKLFVRICVACEVSYWDAPVEARNRWLFYPNLVDIRTDAGSPHVCLKKACRAWTVEQMMATGHVVLRTDFEFRRRSPYAW